ncbi:hypothetical protein ATY77_30805 [Rhizobium sp. R634]|nr:hypothetical protein ATY77_30805 [Rhizobium sp. R634]
MDKRDFDRVLQLAIQRGRSPRPFEPVLRYRPASVERPNYKGLSEPEIKVFESAIEVLLSAAFQGNAPDHLTFDGWQEARSPDLIDRIEITRAAHRFNDRFYECDIPGHDPDSKMRRFQHIRSVYGATPHPQSEPGSHCQYKLHIHPDIDEVFIQTVGGEYVGIFMGRKFVPAALIGLQCEFIKNRFTNPTCEQSSSYSVERGGKKISGSLKRHARDTFDDYQFEARVGDSFPSGFDSMKEQFFDVFAEMRTIMRSV